MKNAEYYVDDFFKLDDDDENTRDELVRFTNWLLEGIIDVNENTFFITYIPHSFVCKNRLEKAVNEFLRSEHRKLIPSDEIEKYKEFILCKINELNAAHKRCKPLEVSFWYPGLGDPDGDSHLSGASFTPFHLLKCNDQGVTNENS